MLATVGVVAANETGIFTINIFNSPQSQLTTNVSNSTVQGQTTYTDSQAVENVTLTNSTLTLNINGQTITITDQGNTIVVGSQNQNVTINNPGATATPVPKPLLTVSYLGIGSEGFQFGNGTQYTFNVTVGVPTSMNYPWGKNVSHVDVSQALLPYADKYDLVRRTSNDSEAQCPRWLDKQVVDGENEFSLFSYSQLSEAQIQALTSDLFNAFTVAMQ